MGEEIESSETGHALQLLQQGSHAESRALLERIVAADPSRADAQHLLGIARYWQGDAMGAVDAFQSAIRLGVDDAATYNNLGNALGDLGHHTQAIAAYQAAIARAPDLPETYMNLGDTLREIGYPEQAIGAYQHATELLPADAEAWNKLGAALFESRRYADAMAAYDRTLECDPDFPFVAGMALHCRMLLHDWQDFTERVGSLLQAVDAGKPAASPFILFSIASSPAQQRRCAEIYAATKYPPLESGTARGQDRPREKVRIAYFSSDFYDHPVARLTAELFERHDRGRFEVIGISCAATPLDAMRHRLESAFCRFFDVRGQTDDDVAALARSLEIDIAVDLTGFTGKVRSGIFARRVAPLQVSYLGYLGSMGAPYIDYLIADSIVVPPEAQADYSEKVVYLPGCFQVNGSHRQLTGRSISRADAGLPPAGFVFCCFNNSYKITPPVFDAWMEILRQTESSVLWLVESDEAAARRLREAARVRGIAADRIVIAPRMDLATYLASYRLADLFLDTFYYSAGTTGSDALWAGLPLLTCPVGTLTGRVAASLLHAVGLPELVAGSPAEYVSIARDLAANPSRMTALRSRLAQNLPGSALFDTPRFVGHLEDAYLQMLERFDNGLAPEHFAVSG